LNMEINHGTFPSIWMDIVSNGTKSPVYRYQQHSFAATHSTRSSFGYAYSYFSDSGKKASNSFNRLNGTYKRSFNKSRVKFKGYNAGIGYFTPK